MRFHPQPGKAERDYASWLIDDGGFSMMMKDEDMPFRMLNFVPFPFFFFLFP